MILLRDCTKILRTARKRTVVLDRVNLVLPRDGVTVVLGKQGAGKTTLVRLLSGMSNPTSGSVQRVCRVSFPFGTFGHFHPRQKAKEVILHIAGVYGAEPRDIIRFLERLPGVAETLEEEMIDLPGPGKLALAYAVGYAMSFDMYVLDTFVSTGTPAFRRLCDAFFAERRRTSGIVLATKSAATARKLADRILILDAGQLKAYASKDEALARYDALASVE